MQNRKEEHEMKGRYFAILLISAVMSGCVSTDIDKSADFSKLKTFSWGESDIDSDHPAYSGELIEKKIRSTIREEFNRKDIAYNPDDPDFLVHYYTHTEK